MKAHSIIIILQLITAIPGLAQGKVQLNLIVTINKDTCPIVLKRMDVCLRTANNTVEVPEVVNGVLAFYASADSNRLQVDIGEWHFLTSNYSFKTLNALRRLDIHLYSRQEAIEWYNGRYHRLQHERRIPDRRILQGISIDDIPFGHGAGATERIIIARSGKRQQR